MPCTPKDHVAQGLSRLITQYRESIKLRAYLEAFLSFSNELEDIHCDVLELRWLATATGVQLNILGDILGRPRSIEKYIAYEFFGFHTCIAAGSFGTLADAGVGSYFYSLTAGDVLYDSAILPDAIFRQFLVAKAMANAKYIELTKEATGELLNANSATINNIIAIAKTFKPTSTITLTEPAPATFKITFSGTLTNTEKLILVKTGYLPKPAGVHVIFADDNEIFVSDD